MHGSNVNWSFLNKFKDENRANPDDPKLIELGCCGLHVIHGAFQTGHSEAGWSVQRVLSATYWLFKDSPARRASYTEITKSKVFPLKFCHIRWVENVQVASRFKQISKEIRLFVEKCDNSRTKELASFKTLVSLFNEDPFWDAKLKFSLAFPR